MERREAKRVLDRLMGVHRDSVEVGGGEMCVFGAMGVCPKYLLSGTKREMGRCWKVHNGGTRAGGERERRALVGLVGRALAGHGREKTPNISSDVIRLGLMGRMEEVKMITAGLCSLCNVCKTEMPRDVEGQLMHFRGRMHRGYLEIREWVALANGCHGGKRT